MGDYTELRRLAEAAEHKDWHLCGDGYLGAWDPAYPDDHDQCIALAALGDDAPMQEGADPGDAAYIAAANPAAVLALLADRDLLVSRLEEARGLLTRAQPPSGWRPSDPDPLRRMTAEEWEEARRAFLAPAPEPAAVEHRRIAGASVYCSCGNGWPCAIALAPAPTTDEGGG